MHPRTPEELAARVCAPCRAETPKLEGAELAAYAGVLPAWTVVSGHHLERLFRFPDYRAAVAFVNRVAALAEAADHHPDLLLTWGKVRVTLFTHTVDGLSENDFVLAAQIERSAEKEA